MSCLSPFFDDIPLTESRQATISHKGFLFSNFAANLSWQIAVKAFVKKSTVYKPAFAQFVSNQMAYEWFYVMFCSKFKHMCKSVKDSSKGL